MTSVFERCHCSNLLYLMDDRLSLQYGTFTANVEGRYLVIIPEMLPAGDDGITPTGRYLICCIDPERGSCHFILEQDEKYEWISEALHPFITKDLLSLIAEAIESKK